MPKWKMRLTGCVMVLCRAIPTPIILACVLWSYYVYVVVLCTNTITDKWKQILYLIVYHFLLIMFMWCYFRTMCAHVATVPEEYKFPRSLCNIFAEIDTDKKRNNILQSLCQKRNLDLITRTPLGNIRFCRYCEQIKPDRAHHCSKCETCILRMDHHCPWVENCIGFSNYKYFILFVSYGSLYCIFFAVTTLEYFIGFFDDPTYYKLHIIAGFVLSVSLAIILTSFAGHHLSLIARNETTLEHMEKPFFRDANLTYDIDLRENFAEVFGERYFLWFIPVWTSLGDGLYFPCRFIFD